MSRAPRLRDALAVWGRNARVFSHVWKGALLPLFLDPLFYLVSLGFGLGTYLATVNGIPYREFIAPGTGRLLQTDVVVDGQAPEWDVRPQ